MPYCSSEWAISMNASLKMPQTAADVLGITLTTHANGKADKIYLAGLPHQALDIYLPKLVRAGLRVAICEQLEKPAQKKTKRAKKA